MSCDYFYYYISILFVFINRIGRVPIVNLTMLRPKIVFKLYEVTFYTNEGVITLPKLPIISIEPSKIP